MLFMAVVDVWEPFEARSKSPAHVRLPFISGTPGCAPSRQFKHAIVGKEGHDFIEVMSVERRADFPQGCCHITHIRTPNGAGAQGLVSPPLVTNGCTISHTGMHSR